MASPGKGERDQRATIWIIIDDENSQAERRLRAIDLTHLGH